MTFSYILGLLLFGFAVGFCVGVYVGLENDTIVDFFRHLF